MVRTKNEILAEVNDEDTVLKSNTSEEFVEDGFIIGADNKTVLRKTMNYGAIIYLSNGNIQELPIEPNKKLGVNANGNLMWI